MKYKYIGYLDPEIASYWHIEKHQNKPILVYDDRIQHVKDKHLKDFGTEEEIIKVYNRLGDIIKKPDYVFYNKKTNGLEYYKKINRKLCVAVRINNSKTLKIRSWYPVNDSKMINRKKKEIINNESEEKW